ncbi:MAG TPA: hypothetical protein DEF45_26995 [Rhodopirellula sp.]|nr:hypothetical protein [Rhodopirellula sp.]
MCTDEQVGSVIPPGRCRHQTGFLPQNNVHDGAVEPTCGLRRSKQGPLRLSTKSLLPRQPVPLDAVSISAKSK